MFVWHAAVFVLLCARTAPRFFMKFADYDLCLITDEKERMYFLGFAATDGYVVHSKNKTAFVVDRRYYYAAKKQLEPKGF